jgi:predicted secreted hydrolase
LVFFSKLFAFFCISIFAATAAFAAPKAASPFPVAPHSDVTIEWWYLNANLRTASGRHLALIGSFFRFGNGKGQVAEDSAIKVKQSHYLIYAITDIDTKKHYAYSLGDKNTLNLLQEASALALEFNPRSAKAQAFAAALSQGTFPPPTRLISQQCSVTGSPFDADYGPGNSVTAVKGSPNTFKLMLGGRGTSSNVSLVFKGMRAPMLVNGDGNTGLRVRTDMKYVSLTRCNVAGTIGFGGATEKAEGEGWFDHQWGNSWTTQSAGWNWWGAQLKNGTDILFFEQLNLSDGTTFFPCATFEKPDGTQVTTHNIVFSYTPSSEWKSPTTGVTYPLEWTVTFPDQQTTLKISPDMLDEEMPVLASGGAIWEGACTVDAQVKGAAVPGVAYQELVGYNSPAVHLKLTPPAGSR